MNCLFGYYSSVCSYFGNNQVPSFFSLGEAVGAFGLIFAVYQLRKPSWEIVFKIRERWQSNLFWYLGFAGLFAVGLSAVISQIPNNWLSPPFNIPLFYELLGFLCFILAPSSLFYLGRKRTNLFNKKTAERYYQVLLSEIARPKDENLEACVDIIASNLPEILQAVIGKRNRPREELISKPPTEEENFAGYADAILTVILSDKRITRYIVTGRLDFLIHLIRELEESGVHGNHTNLGIEKIIEALFTDDRSHLHNQLDFRGLTLSANIYDAIFSNPYMMSNFKIFRSTPHSYGEFQLDGSYVSVYIKAIEHAVNGYWENKCDDRMRSEICWGFRQLQDYSQWLARTANDKRKREKCMSQLGNIGFFLGHTYVWRYRDMLKIDNISEYEKSTSRTNSFYQSVNSAYSECLLHYLEALATIEDDRTDSVRLYALSATTELIGVTCHHGDDLESIRQSLITQIWDKICGPNTMSNERGFFPVIARVYISHVGFHVGEDSTTVSEIERKKIIKFLEEKIKPKILSGELMKNNKTTFEKAFLPSDIILNRTTGKFEYIMSNGSHQVME